MAIYSTKISPASMGSCHICTVLYVCIWAHNSATTSAVVCYGYTIYITYPIIPTLIICYSLHHCKSMSLRKCTCIPVSSTTSLLSTSLVLAMLIHEHLLWDIWHVFMESWIPDEFTNALNRITDPKLMLLNYRLVIFIKKFFHHLHYFALPFGPSW